MFTKKLSGSVNPNFNLLDVFDQFEANKQQLAAQGITTLAPLAANNNDIEREFINEEEAIKYMEFLISLQDNEGEYMCLRESFTITNI